MHKDGCIYANDIFVELHHGLPPVFAYVFFEFGTHLAVVVHRREAVVYLTRRENEAILLGMGNYIFENIIRVHGAKISGTTEPRS